MTRALLQQALDVLEHDVMQATYAGGVKISNVAIAIRAELAKPAQQDRKPMSYEDRLQITSQLSEDYADGDEWDAALIEAVESFHGIKETP